MLNILKKLWDFAGEERKNVNASIGMGFLYAVFHMFQVGAIYCVVLALTEHEQGYSAAWTALLLLVISIAGKTVTNYFSSCSRPTPDILWWPISGWPSAIN